MRFLRPQKEETAEAAPSLIFRGAPPDRATYQSLSEHLRKARLLIFAQRREHSPKNVTIIRRFVRISFAVHGPRRKHCVVMDPDACLPRLVAIFCHHGLDGHS